ATGSVSHPVTVTAPPPPNQPPVSSSTRSRHTISLRDWSSGMCSDDPIASYRWTFGDGTAAVTTQNPSHTYTAGGTFTVTLTVTRSEERRVGKAHRAPVTAPPSRNNATVAAITSSHSQHDCIFTIQRST